MIARAAFLVFIGLALGACTHKGPTSILGGECKIFERPPYEVEGKKQYDQDWIDSQIEGGVGGCNWQRPAERPPSIDAGRAVKPVIAPVKKKRSLIRRIKDRVKIWPDNPAPVVAAPLPIPEPPPPPPAPPKPRSAIDELLHPSEPIRKVR